MGRRIIKQPAYLQTLHWLGCSTAFFKAIFSFKNINTAIVTHIRQLKTFVLPPFEQGDEYVTFEHKSFESTLHDNIRSSWPYPWALSLVFSATRWRSWNSSTSFSFHRCRPWQSWRRAIKFNLVGAFLSVWPCFTTAALAIDHVPRGSLSDRSSRWWRAEDSERLWKRPRVRVGPRYKSRHSTVNLA